MDMGRYVHYSILSCYINYCTVHPDADFECLAVLMEHTQDVKSVAWHPSREILASASYDDTIKLYIDDPDDDWYCFSTLTGHTSTVWSVSFSPNGSYLASGSEDCLLISRGWGISLRSWAYEVEATRMLAAASERTRRKRDRFWANGLGTFHGRMDCGRTADSPGGE